MAGYRTIISKVKKTVDREEWLGYELKEFAHANKDLVIIALDPKTDFIFVGHRDINHLSKIKSADGKDYSVIDNFIKKSRLILDKKQRNRFWQTGIYDRFLASLTAELGLSLKPGEGALFYQHVCHLLAKIGQMLHVDKKGGKNAIMEAKGEGSPVVEKGP